ncbi:unknown [Prevotella sp. CAG:1124]|nr:unknown [Prevotella sp. CAG:1124]
MKLNDRSFKVFIYSGLGVSIPILAVGVAMLLSGYRISPEAKFWLWFVVVLSAVVMVFSLIRLLCDFIPVDKISRRLRKNVVSVQDNSLKTSSIQSIQHEHETQNEEHTDQHNAMKAYFIKQYVNKAYVDEPVFETYEELFKENKGGKNVVLAFYCGADTNMNWLISIPSYTEAVRMFGEDVVGSKNNYSVQKSNLVKEELDDKKLTEIRTMKLLMKKIMASKKK